jgi:isopenicillin-N N-acyltransferase like protein
MRKKLLKALVIAFCLLLTALLAALAAGYWYIHPGRGAQLAVDPAEKAYVEEVDGTMVLHLKGTPYEMGYQHGALARDQVQASFARFDALIEEAKDEVGLSRFAADLLLDFVYARCAKYIPERYKREMEGIADGAGIPLQMVRRCNVLSVVTERGCSSFVAFGKATGNGKTYHGRNFDWIMEGGLQDSTALILYEPDDGVPFASVAYVGNVGAVSGMNMEGIAIGQIGAISTDTRLDGLPLMLILRSILEEAQDLDEAGAIIKNARRTVGYNYVLADGDTGEGRVYETCANHCVEFRDNDPKETVEYAIPIEDVVMRSDEAMDQTVRSFQRCANDYPNMPYGSNSYDHRYKGMATRIQENHGKIDENVAVEITKAVAMRGANLHGVVCNCTDREIWVAHAKGTDDAWKQTFIHYDLKQLFLPPGQRTKK